MYVRRCWALVDWRHRKFGDMIWWYMRYLICGCITFPTPDILTVFLGHPLPLFAGVILLLFVRCCLIGVINEYANDVNDECMSVFMCVCVNAEMTGIHSMHTATCCGFTTSLTNCCWSIMNMLMMLMMSVCLSLCVCVNTETTGIHSMRTATCCGFTTSLTSCWRPRHTQLRRASHVRTRRYSASFVICVMNCWSIIALKNSSPTVLSLSDSVSSAADLFTVDVPRRSKNFGNGCQRCAAKSTALSSTLCHLMSKSCFCFFRPRMERCTDIRSI